MILAGCQMLAPKKLWSLTGNHVFHMPSRVRRGPFLTASSVVSFGATCATLTLTGAGAAPLPPPRTAAAMADAVAGTSRRSPFFAGATPMTRPRDLKYTADMGARFTPLATGFRALGER